MPEGSLLFSPAPYHVLSYATSHSKPNLDRDANNLSTYSYGALLGTQFFHVSVTRWYMIVRCCGSMLCIAGGTILTTYQTFINSITSFKVLERRQFAILQRAVFPAYFGIQTVAPVVLALTYPGGAGRVAALPQGINGVLHPANRWGVLVPLTAVFVTGLANWVYFLPETNKVTALRRQQGICP